MCRVCCGMGLGLGTGNLHVGDLAWHGEMVLDCEASVRHWEESVWIMTCGVGWCRYLRDVASGLRADEEVTVAYPN